MGRSNWWLPGVKSNAFPLFVFSFPPPHIHGPSLPATVVTWCNHSCHWTSPSLGLLLASITVDLLWEDTTCSHSWPMAAGRQDGNKGKDTSLCKTLEPFLHPPALVKTTSLLPNPVINYWSPPYWTIDYAILLKTCSCLGIEKPTFSVFPPSSWAAIVTESKLVLLTAGQTNQLRDEVLGQGIAALFGQPADQEDGE